MELLLSYGIEYDHSMSHEDCQMYYLRTGDSWTKIDYSKKVRASRIRRICLTFLVGCGVDEAIDQGQDDWPRRDSWIVVY